MDPNKCRDTSIQANQSTGICSVVPTFLHVASILPLMLIVSCGYGSGVVYRITYANHTGRWISGTAKLNNYVRDIFESRPYSHHIMTMHPRHSSGREYEIEAQDVFSKEVIRLHGKTPHLPTRMDRPNLIVELVDSKRVHIQWVNDSRSDFTKRAEDTRKKQLQVIPAVARQENGLSEIDVAIRQRPRAFVSILGKIAVQSDWSLPFLYAFSEMVDPRRSPEMVIFFEAEDEQGEVVTWRDVVDCRQVVGAPEEGAMFWIEIGREGEYRLGWGQSNERDLRQLRRLLDENALMEPQQWWTGRAKQHPKLPVYSLHSRQTYDFPDLRFDDEIQQQMQQAGR